MSRSPSRSRAPVGRRLALVAQAISTLGFLSVLGGRPAVAQERKIGLGEVKVGQRLEVRGRLRADGALVAESLELKDPGDRVEVTGVIRAVEDSNIQVLSVTFSVDEDTEIVDEAGSKTTVASFVSGRWVRASGRIRPGGRIEARSVRFVASRRSDREEIEGRVDEVHSESDGTLSFRIGPQRIVPPPGLEGENLLLSGVLFPSGPRVVPKGAALGYRSVDEEEWKPLSVHLFGEFYFGGTVRYEVRYEDDFDLNRRQNEDVGRTGIFTEFRIAGSIGEHLFALAELRIKDEEVICDHERDLSLGEDTKGGENFLFYRGLFDLPVDVQVGRQDFDEYREWIYDADLDAVRFFVRLPPVNLEFSVSEVLFDSGRMDENVVNYIAYGSCDVTTRHQAALYVVDRRDRDNSDELLSIGARARGEPVDALHYWAEWAIARGMDEPERIHGYGLDLGATLVLPGEFEPSVTVGYAYGSGDDSPGSGVDRTFRQTGLQDNNGRWNSVTSFKYYGELFEPELRNLQILSAGAGVRPTQRTSVDLVGHYYTQAETAVMQLRPISNLRQNTGGESPRLGWETDLIVGFREFLGFRVELVLGWFHPSSAFERSQNDAYLVQFQVDYRF